MRFLLAMGLVAAIFSSASAQEKWPSRAVTIMVGFAAGGPNDIAARAVADGLSKKWGQPVIVENRPGGNSVIANMAVKNSSPDGYRLLLANTGSTVIKPAVEKNMPYNALTDFTSLALLGDYPFLVVTSKDAPFSSIPEFIAYAKANPETVTFSSAAALGAGHIGMELMRVLTGTEMRHVPYSGDAPSIPDIVAGRVTVGIAALHLTLPLVKDGQMKALGVTSLERSELDPAIPTVAETMPELAGFAVMPFSGIVGPQGMPTHVVERINADINEVLRSPVTKEKLSVLAYVLRPGPPQQLHDLMKAEMQKWRDAVQKARLITD